MVINLVAGTRFSAIHDNATSIFEPSTCEHGLAPELNDVVSTCGMQISGTDELGETRCIERVDHPFFLAALYQPQLRSTLQAAHPLFLEFVRAVELHRA